MIDTKILENHLDLLDEIDEQEEKLKKLKKQKQDNINAINTMFANAGAGKTEVRGVVFSPKRTMRASTAKGCMPMLAEGLRRLGDGAEHLVKDTVNANSLASWVREFDTTGMMSEDEIKAALPDEVRDYVNVYEQNMLSLTGRSKK